MPFGDRTDQQLGPGVYVQRTAEQTQFRLLGQLRPANTTAASIYSPDDFAIVDRILVCNQGGITPKFRIFLDNDGTTYDETTALYWDIALDADQTVEIDGPLYMANSSGNLAVRTDTADDVTFTVFGREIRKAR